MMDDGNENESTTASPPSTFPTVYQTIWFLLSLWLAGDLLCGRIIRILPPLVGQIAVGMLVWGPHGLGLGWMDDDAFRFPLGILSILGEVGLVLLLVQAGLAMDLLVLQHVGMRAMVMALLGSVLPTVIGTVLAYSVLGVDSFTAALAVGCSFGPTSAGIALNVLQPCGVLATPLGQLIVAIAIIDDIIALVVLSLLQVLTANDDGGGVKVAAIAVPIVSALAWLFVGGGIALYVMPKLLARLDHLEQRTMSVCRRFVKMSHGTNHHVDDDTTVKNTGGVTTDMTSARELPQQQQQRKLAHVVLLLVTLLPGTYYSRSSHLLGAFLAGLSLCQQDGVKTAFDREFGRVVEWLMRLFFGATIAFSIPFHLFQDGRVVAHGALLCLALLGKVVIGPLLTPLSDVVVVESAPGSPSLGSDVDIDNDNQHGAAIKRNVPLSPPVRSRRWGRKHCRDCLVVGFSMAGEAEFALVVAAFGYTEGLVTESIYASTVLAILASTIISPCLLRMTLAFTDDRDEARNRRDGAEAQADENDAKDADDVERDRHIDEDDCNNISATARAQWLPHEDHSMHITRIVVPGSGREAKLEALSPE
jgi:Kef-type K+ transport system membrane component KefB